MAEKTKQIPENKGNLTAYIHEDKPNFLDPTRTPIECSTRTCKGDNAETTFQVLNIGSIEVYAYNPQTLLNIASWAKTAWDELTLARAITLARAKAAAGAAIEEVANDVEARD